MSEGQHLTLYDAHEEANGGKHWFEAYLERAAECRNAQAQSCAVNKIGQNTEVLSQKALLST